MTRDVQRRVRKRARNRCEYCWLPQSASRLRHQIDHIIARQHGGNDAYNNLALCCARCNQRKGPNLSGQDPETGEIVCLFHPRHNRWREHFSWDGAVLVGKTPVGRATIAVLAINAPSLIEVREALIEEGRFPPR